MTIMGELPADLVTLFSSQPRLTDDGDVGHKCSMRPRSIDCKKRSVARADRL